MPSYYNNGDVLVSIVSKQFSPCNCYFVYFLPVVNMCGIAHIKPDLVNPHQRTIGGREVIPHAWPWQVHHFTGECLI